MSARVGQGLKAMAFLAPSLLGMGAFVLIPFAGTVVRSFRDTMGERWVGVSNYQSVFENEAFRLASANTLRFVAICIPLLLLLSLGLALLLQACGRKTRVLGSIFLLPLAIPVASVALIWQVIFAEHGLLSGFLVAIGQPFADWINQDSAFWVLVASYLWRNVGYDMVLWQAGLSGIDPALYEAAQVDGAGAFRRFLYITVPTMLPTLYTIAVLSLLNSFKVFREAYLIAGNYPHSSMYMLQHLFNNWFTALDMQKLCAAAVLVAIHILALVLLLGKFWGGEEA